MKLIPLSDDIFTIVDDWWFSELVSRGPWHSRKDGNYVYAYHAITPDKGIYLHHLILSKRTDLVVDHINRNTLDNREENLRYATIQENVTNRGLGKNNTTGVLGVSFHKARQKWRARVMKDRKEIHLGFFDTFEEAVQARLAGEVAYFGSFAPQANNLSVISGSLPVDVTEDSSTSETSVLHDDTAKGLDSSSTYNAAEIDKLLE